MGDVKYAKFRVDEVLSVEQTKSVVAKKDLVDGDIPYVTRTVSNNGHFGLCGNADRLNSGNCITIGAETGVAFYQPYDVVAGNKVYRLSRDGLGESEYLYLVATLNLKSKDYSYSNARIPEKIRAEVIELPIISSGEPDWDYMAERIAELEAERIAELEAYLVATGLDDCELTDEDREVLGREVETKEFRVGELFTQLRGKEASPNRVVDGSLPMINEISVNNGLAKYGDSKHVLPGNAITISVNYATNVFYQPVAFIASVNVLAIYNENLDYRSGLFVCAALKKAHVRYDYNHKISRDRLNDECISLPVTSAGTPDWDYMRAYIRAQEKLVMAGVADMTQKRIDATREIVGA
jgi:hypothetical protein